MLQRLFAPFLPFVTEEVWRWWQEGSVHRAAWPGRAEVAAGEPRPTPPRSTRWARCWPTSGGAKTEAKVSQRAVVEQLTVTAPPEFLDRAAAPAPTTLRDAAA